MSDGATAETAPATALSLTSYRYLHFAIETTAGRSSEFPLLSGFDERGDAMEIRLGVFGERRGGLLDIDEESGVGSDFAVVASGDAGVAGGGLRFHFSLQLRGVDGLS